MVRDDLVMNVRKFLSQINHTIQQVEGEIKLQLPDIPNMGNGPLQRDSHTIERVERCVVSWTESIQSVMTTCKEKDRTGSGPLGEIEYWKERNGIISSMWEQIKLSQVILGWEIQGND